MADKEVRAWKKVFESDLAYVVSELKESIGRPSILILSGEMGTGKTSFAKIFASDGLVQSPTYSLISETPTVAHADFYRLKDSKDIVHLEIGLYLENKDYFLVEWGKKYLKELLHEVDESFQVYELLISTNTTSQKSCRDYVLFKIDKSSY